MEHIHDFIAGSTLSQQAAATDFAAVQQDAVSNHATRWLVLADLRGSNFPVVPCFVYAALDGERRRSFDRRA
jgi:hypothetical protein